MDNLLYSTLGVCWTWGQHVGRSRWQHATPHGTMPTGHAIPRDGYSDRRRRWASRRRPTCAAVGKHAEHAHHPLGLRWSCGQNVGRSSMQRHMAAQASALTCHRAPS